MYRAIFITEDLIVTHHAVATDNPQKLADQYAKEVGNYPERILVLTNGVHPDRGCYDDVAPDVVNDFSAEEDFSTGESGDRLTQLKQAIKRFEELQGKYAKYGAADTEPDGVFQTLLANAVIGNPVKVPQTVDGWDLYRKSESEQAAAQLAEVASDCVKLIENTPVKEFQPVKDFIQGYCWRVDIRR